MTRKGIQVAMQPALSILQNAACFRGLPYSARSEIAAAARRIDLPKGQVLFMEGEAARDAYVIRTGRVHLEHVQDSGSVRALCVMGPGDLFCRLPLLDGGPYPATALTARPTCLYCIPIPLLRGHIQGSATFAQAVLLRVAQCLRRVGCQSCHGDAGARIAFKILAMSDQFGSDVPLTRRELGELAGTSVETAIREIKYFERRGWVHLKRGHVSIVDRTALRLRSEGGFNGVS